MFDFVWSCRLPFGHWREEQAEVVEFVDFLKSPKKYEKLGARVPKGISVLNRGILHVAHIDIWVLA